LGTQGNWVDIENARLTGSSNLNVTGRETDNTLIGNKGINVLDGGDGIDTLEGGLNNDTYVVDTTTDKLNEVNNELNNKGEIKDGWIDTVQSEITFDISKLFNFENLSLTGSTSINGTGNLNSNEIRGNDSVNLLKGLAGNDILDGAGGIDTLMGGTGDDIYRLSNDGDIIKELAGEGTDTIEIQNTFSLSSPNLKNNIENLALMGTIAIDGTGTNGNNVLTGNSASNMLTGLSGADTLIGKDGADTLIGGKGTDTLDLTESKADKDVVRFALGDSIASANEADKVIKFALFYDTLDLAGTIKIAANSAAIDGEDVGTIKSHKIDNGIIKFDDTGSFVSSVPISVNNLSNAIEYLKQNITNQSTVAFQVGSDLWVFQDSGATDTLIDLVGVSGVSNLNALHIV
jgi:Ca2+-binding RTX toxin-like protein